MIERSAAGRVVVHIGAGGRFDDFGFNKLVDAIGIHRVQLDYTNLFQNSTPSESDASSSDDFVESSPTRSPNWVLTGEYIGNRGFDADLFE